MKLYEKHVLRKTSDLFFLLDDFFFFLNDFFFRCIRSCPLCINLFPLRKILLLQRVQLLLLQLYLNHVAILILARLVSWESLFVKFSVLLGLVCLEPLRGRR